jgi:hypothetical protein
MALSALLIAHGVAHLVGFAVPWRLISTPDVPYRTTLLGGAIDVGDAGARAVGILWLVAAAGFVLLGSAGIAGWSVRSPLYVALVLSLTLCVLGWPDARIGVWVNVMLLGVLLLMRGTAL